MIGVIKITKVAWGGGGRAIQGFRVAGAFVYDTQRCVTGLDATREGIVFGAVAACAGVGRLLLRQKWIDCFGIAAKFRYNPLTANIEVFAALASIGNHHVRVHVGREVGRARAGAAQHAIHEDALAIAGGLHSTFAGCVVPVIAHIAVVAQGKEAVFLVPEEFALVALQRFACGRALDRVYANQVAVGVVAVGLAFTDGIDGCGSFGAIALVGDGADLLRIAGVGIRQVVAGLQGPGELDVVLHNLLFLAGDVVQVVVAHSQGVGGCFIVAARVGTRGGGEAVQTVVAVGMIHPTTETGYGHIGVLHTQHVVHMVIGISIVHQLLANLRALYAQIAQVAGFRIVGVVGLSSITILHIGALLKLIVAKITHIKVYSSAFCSFQAGKQSSSIVTVGELFTVGISHGLHAVPAVVGPLGHIRGHRLVGDDQCATHFSDFPHLAILEFLTAAAVNLKNKATSTVIRCTGFAILIDHIVLFMLRIGYHSVGYNHICIQFSCSLLPDWQSVYKEARAISSHHSTIGKDERDEVKPTIDVVRKLAQVLDTTVSYLMGETKS
jgi:hypothetical protein